MFVCSVTAEVQNTQAAYSYLNYKARCMSVVPNSRPHLWADRDETLYDDPLGTLDKG